MERMNEDEFKARVMAMSDTLLQYCREFLPEESGGFFVQVPHNGHLLFHPAKNIHGQRENNIAMSERDYIAASKKGDVIGMLHSHSNATIHNGKCAFTDVDMYTAQKLNLYSVLALYPDQRLLFYFHKDEHFPYVGRPWHYPTFDCLNLIRDVFLWELGIEISDYERYEDEWFIPGWNKYVERFEENGFIDIPLSTPLQKFDVVMFTIRIKNPNHGGVVWDFLPDGTPLFLHHLQNHRSEIRSLTGSWERRLSKVVRHKSFLPMKLQERKQIIWRN